MRRLTVARALGTLLVTLMALTACGGAEADYPDSAITMMVPFREGGGTDRQGRTLAAELEAELGQPVNVINNAGAGGTVGAQELLASEPDGLTIMFGVSSALTIQPQINDLSYSVSDFNVVAITSTFQTALVTRADAPYDTWDEFVAYANENPGLKHAFLGADGRLLMEQIAAAEGLEFEYVPAQGGADLAPLLFSGDVDFGFSGGIHVNFLDVEDPAEGMKVLLNLGSTGPLAATPDAPASVDLYDGLASDVQAGFVVPADTPEAIVEKLAAAIEVAVNSDAYNEVLAGLQFPKSYTGYPDAQAVWQAQYDAFDG